MKRTAENARRIAADIVRLAKTADPDDYQYSTALAKAEEADVIDTITQDLLSDDLHAELGWLVELILADTTREEDAAAAQDLQFELLQWIAADPPRYPAPVTVSSPAYSADDLDALEDRCLDMGDTDID